MSDVTLFTLVILLTSAVLGIHGYPTGAPVGQCNAMTPQHGTQPQQNANAPYTVTSSKSTYYGGEMITVSVMGGNSQFKGLMLQARDANNQRVGTFSLTAGETNLKLLSCDNVMGTAVTHTNRNMKNSISATWTAPMTDIGAVTFRATVVEQFNTFYVGLTAQPITFMAMTQPTTNVNNTMPTMAPNDNPSNDMSNDMPTYGRGNSVGRVTASLATVFAVAFVFSFVSSL